MKTEIIQALEQGKIGTFPQLPKEGYAVFYPAFKKTEKKVVNLIIRQALIDGHHIQIDLHTVRMVRVFQNFGSASLCAVHFGEEPVNLGSNG